MYFKGVGHIYTRSNRDHVAYTVTKLEEILDVIIPHFDKYPSFFCKTKTNDGLILF